MALQHIGVFELGKVYFDHAQKDLLEEASDFLLAPMRILFGLNYTVNSDHTFTLNTPSVARKVAAVAGLILGGIVLAPLIGVAIAYFSGSRSQIYEKSYRLFWVNRHNQLNISDDELNQVKNLEGKEDHLARAFGGKTPVWLPVDHPGIIIKASGYFDRTNEKRAVQMHSFKEVLRGLGIQNIVVPQCHVSGKYQIESRLPINTHDFHNIRLYIENQKAFDDVIKELVKVASRYWFTDLITTSNNQLAHLDGGDGRLVRYDNFPLYIENGVGKVGLVDLEAMKAKYFLLDPLLFLLGKMHESFKGLRYLEPIESLVRMFPYHRDLICSEALKNLIFYSPAEVKKAYDAGMASMNKGYIEFRDWLKVEGKLNAHSLTFVIPEVKHDEIVGELQKRILEKNPKLSSDQAVGEAKKAVNEFVESINKRFTATELSEGASEDQIVEARNLRLQLWGDYCDMTGDLLVEHKLLYSYKFLPNSGAYRISLVRV